MHLGGVLEVLGVLEVSLLVYTLGLTQSAALQLSPHCSSQERRLPLRLSICFKQ